MTQTIGTIRQIGAAIRARRKDVGLTATHAAALASVSRRLLIELEGGKRPNVGFAAVLRILDVLGLDLTVGARSLPGTRVPAGRRPGV